MKRRILSFVFLMLTSITIAQVFEYNKRSAYDIKENKLIAIDDISIKFTLLPESDLIIIDEADKGQIIISNVKKINEESVDGVENIYLKGNITSEVEVGIIINNHSMSLLYSGFKYVFYKDEKENGE